ncbi:MAG: hypothetical protein PSN04_03290 [Methyloprofundus sp.]|nr:hypothetical protein [Methyloprofundus sp.]
MNHHTPEFNPKKPCATSLFDATHNATERAEAVIYLLQQQFISSGEQTLDSGVIFAALETVRFSLLDIKEMVSSFHESKA